jgi:hypothetical protein
MRDGTLGNANLATRAVVRARSIPRAGSAADPVGPAWALQLFSLSKCAIAAAG